MDLRPYQKEAKQFALAHPRCLIEMDMRMGKTAVAVTTIKECQPRNLLIICPTSVLYHWPAECERWGYIPSEGFSIAHGLPWKRVEAWKGTTVITTMGTLMRDLSRPSTHKLVDRKWDMIVLDESQIIRNRKTKAFKAMSRLLHPHSERRLTRVMLTTGTQSREGAKDYFTTLALMSPKRFTSYWRFVNTFCHVVHNGFGHEVFGTRNAEKFNDLMKHYRYLRKRHQEDMPPKTRTILPYEMAPPQRKVYNQLVEKLYAELEDGHIIMTPMIMSRIMRLRQLLVMPALVDPSNHSEGGALEVILDHIKTQDVQNAAIFTSFKAAIPHITEVLQKHFPKRPIYAFTGDNTATQTRERELAFRASGGFALASVRYSKGYSLKGVEASYMLGPEWTPDDNEQAEDRMVDMEERIEANVYYPLCKGTVEEDVILTVADKRRAVELSHPAQSRQNIRMWLYGEAPLNP